MRKMLNIDVGWGDRRKGHPSGLLWAKSLVTAARAKASRAECAWGRGEMWMFAKGWC